MFNVVEGTISTETKFVNKWKIDNFKQVKEVFLQGQEEFSWKLELKEKEYQTYLFLHCESTSCQPVSYSAFILNNDGEIVNVRSLTVGHADSSGSKYDWFISLNELNKLDSQLTLGCEVRMSQRTTVHCGIVSEKQRDDDFSISRDLDKLLLSSTLSDFVIRVGDHEFRVHKCVLAARSKVFATMFKNDTTENLKNCMDLEHFETTEQFLRFIYTDKLPETTECAHRLLPLADGYLIQKLKDWAENATIRLLDSDCALHWLVTAHLHSYDRLKRAALHFVADHNADVVSREEWREMKDRFPFLVEEIKNVMTEKNIEYYDSEDDGSAIDLDLEWEF